MIYLDNAATTRMRPEVVSEMLPWYEEEYGNPSSVHQAGRRARRALNDARERMAQCLGCFPDEILFTSGGSEANTQAIAAASCTGRSGILCSAVEHHSVLRAAAAMQRQGMRGQNIEVHADGSLDMEGLEEQLREHPDTALVSVMYVNNETGTIFPVREVGAMCRKRGILFHTDAVQAAGKLPIDLKEWPVDLLSLSAHKFHGPKGIGALYVRRGTEVPNVIYGGQQERGLRPGTENVPAIMGMARALELSAESMESSCEALGRMGAILRTGLDAIPGTHCIGADAEHFPGIWNVCCDAVEGESLLLMLDSQGICVSTASACASASHEPSHVLRAFGVPPEMARSAIRISLSPENTCEEIQETMKVLSQVLALLRGAASSGTAPRAAS